MKYLFIKPIDYIFQYAPIIGIPGLIGILEEQGYESSYLDLNMEFLNIALNSNFKLNTKSINNIKTNSNYPSIINDIIQNHKNNFFLIEKNFSQITEKSYLIKKILSKKELFYDKFLCEFAIQNLKKLQYTFMELSDIYFTEKLIPNVKNYRTFVNNDKFYFDINSIKFYFDNKFSHLNDFYDEKINEILKEEPDCIGINIGIYTSLISGLLLAYKIKQKSNIYINIGGAFFHSFHYMIENMEDVISIFCDSISVFDNSNTVLDIMKYLKKEIEIEEVDNIFYKKSNELRFNKQKKSVNISTLPPSSFTGYKLDNFMIPERILPVRASISCYWHKCIFCICSGENEYQIKSPENFIKEIEYLKNKYNTKYFYFWDNALPPFFLDKFADILLKKKIKIKFSLYARLEKEFNFKLLKKLKKCGCIQIHWGLDSCSQKILNFINKGIQLNTASRILQASSNAGISNYIYLIFGYPTETKEDIVEAYNFIKKNKKYINELNIAEDILIIPNSILYQNRMLYSKQIIPSTKERKKYIENLLNLIYTEKTYNVNRKSVPLIKFLYTDKFGFGIKSIIYLYIYKKILNIKIKGIFQTHKILH